MIQVDVGRFRGHARALFTRSWEHIPAIRLSATTKGTASSSCTGRNVERAEAAGKGIDFVHVDIYDSNRGPLIGEMTCFPQAGTGRFSPSCYDDWLGAFW
jgi:TupA-like ATPgrasp